jgi:hypothetical protein
MHRSWPWPRFFVRMELLDFHNGFWPADRPRVALRLIARRCGTIRVFHSLDPEAGWV